MQYVSLFKVSPVVIDSRALTIFVRDGISVENGNSFKKLILKANQCCKAFARTHELVASANIVWAVMFAPHDSALTVAYPYYSDGVHSLELKAESFKV